MRDTGWLHRVRPGQWALIGAGLILASNWPSPFWSNRHGRSSRIPISSSNRYRAVTISLDYCGDSVINSASDIVAMVVGFLGAAKLSVRTVVVLTIVMELVVGYFIHDNLALNILMLLYPLDAVRRWQSAM